MATSSASSLRIVAEEQPRSALAAMAFEPTGSAVRMYSSMTAASIFFLRLLMSMISSAGTRSRRLLALLAFEC